LARAVRSVRDEPDPLLAASAAYAGIGLTHPFRDRNDCTNNFCSGGTCTPG
jgi:hypothetical protein